MNKHKKNKIKPKLITDFDGSFDFKRQNETVENEDQQSSAVFI